jgi:2-oxoglutarate ferredoxin oxidoreductase subunit gamma
VIISEKAIDYPFVQYPDILILMSQEACTAYLKDVKKDALLLVDEDLVRVEECRGARILRIPSTRMAEGLQKKIVANIVMLGFFASVTDAVSREAMEKAIGSSVPAPTVDLNLKAFRAGFDYGKELLERCSSAGVIDGNVPGI